MKRMILSLAFLASLDSVNAFADDRQLLGTIAGGAVGAVVGDRVAGNTGVVVGGIGGAVIGHELTKPEPRGNIRVIREEPRPVYVQPQPIYVQPQPAYIVEEEHHHKHKHHPRGHAYGHYKHHGHDD